MEFGKKDAEVAGEGFGDVGASEFVKQGEGEEDSVLRFGSFGRDNGY